MRSTIAQIKRVSPEETIGYNRKGILHRETLIGTVCVGYADGIPRNIGNGKGYMLVKGKPAPIDSVLIFGTELSVKQLAEWAGTIPYEILTGISQRVKRVYFDE